MRFHSSPSAEELRQFDAVILATGGKVARPAIPGIDSSRVCTFEDVLRCEVEGCEYYPTDRQPPIECGAMVLVWGDHFAAADSAEKLAADGNKVYVVTGNREFAQWMEPCHRDVMFKRFAGSNGEGLTGKPFQHAVTVIPNTTVVEIADTGEVTLMDHRFRKSTLAVDNVVLASVVPEDSLYDQLLEAEIPAVKIGDLKRVRNLLSAVREGTNAALTIDEGLALNANGALASRHPTEVTLGA